MIVSAIVSKYADHLPLLRGVLGVKPLTLGDHLVHDLSLHKSRGVLGAQVKWHAARQIRLRYVARYSIFICLQRHL
jgi:hypothetical protein